MPALSPKFYDTLETGVNNVSMSIWKSCMFLWKNIVVTPDTSLIYYKSSIRPLENKAHYNWVTQILVTRKLRIQTNSDQYNVGSFLADLEATRKTRYNIH